MFHLHNDYVEKAAEEEPVKSRERAHLMKIKWYKLASAHVRRSLGQQSMRRKLVAERWYLHRQSSSSPALSYGLMVT